MLQYCCSNAFLKFDEEQQLQCSLLDGRYKALDFLAGSIPLKHEHSVSQEQKYYVPCCGFSCSPTPGTPLTHCSSCWYPLAQPWAAADPSACCQEEPTLPRLIYPCRSLREAVKRSCAPLMACYGYPWPEILNCNKFPADHELCVAAVSMNENSSSRRSKFGSFLLCFPIGNTESSADQPVPCFYSQYFWV